MSVRRLVPALVLLIMIVVLFVAVFPTRTWLAQQREMAGATEQLHVLERENERLAERVDDLRSDDEIERLAREQYNLVKPGEEAYALLPPTGSSAAEVPPSEVEAEQGEKRTGLRKVWDFLTGWL